MGICKNITGIIRSRKQDIEPYLKFTQGGWDERLKHIESCLNKKLFRWDKIPGRDSDKLIDFLKSEFGIDWIRPEQIERVDDNNIKASNENKSVLLKLSDEKKVTLYLNNNIMDEFIVKKDKAKLFVYYESVENIPERDLTFIIACAYAINGIEGCNSLMNIVCGHELPKNYEKESNQIWFEFKPHICKDPLSGVGGKAHSELDLAFGNFTVHEKSEIVYQPNDEGWVCFVEMKILADISGDSTDNPTYNQIVKYIKSAFTFQDYAPTSDKKYPTNIHITIITPKKFIENPHSRLYGYKFKEYVHEDENTNIKTIDVNNIKSDIPKSLNNEYFSRFFSWDDVINGDYDQFKDFLKYYFDIKYLKDDNIKKSDSNKSISVCDDQGGNLLSIINNITNVRLISNNNIKKLFLNTENGKQIIRADKNLYVDLWNRPDIDERLKKLNLHWIPYENIVDGVPIENPLKDFINKIRTQNPIFESSESK